ncbi:type II toxin-antitoxin system VapC family toxin [Shinella oryzae]|uniref:type II toxin-antitoxin system VapC family toxin n=1 Tax=Shinella oryzae TaxID=2871820 RepID=UPI001FF622D8|nr:type II toxin-antitoxin system VapC family toxin [Shinella oryzae]
MAQAQKPVRRIEPRGFEFRRRFHARTGDVRRSGCRVLTAFLLDTNVLSASRRPQRQADEFQAFLRTFDVDTAYISTVTIMEIEFGIQRVRLQNPPFADDLLSWLTTIVLPEFSGRIIPFDTREASLAGRLTTPHRQPTADAMIAATALAHRLVLVTRNVADFQTFGVSCLNPWQTRLED